MAIPRARPEFHVEDIGTVIEFEVRTGRNTVLDLSELCFCEVYFMRPDGSCFVRSAQFLPAEDSLEPEGANGVLFYILQNGDLDVPGNWHMQIAIGFISSSWSSSVVPFVVFPNLVHAFTEAIAP